MARHGKKRKNKKSSVNKQDASLKGDFKQQASGQAYENNEYDGDLRKHKKKCKGKKLTYWEAAILFLLLKENGVLDELLESDEFNEFGEFKEFKEPKEFKEFKELKESKEFKEKDEYKEFDTSSKFKKAEAQLDKEDDQENGYSGKNKVSQFDFDYFAED